MERMRVGVTNCGDDEEEGDACVVGRGGGVDGVVESGTAASQRWRALSTFVHQYRDDMIS